MATGPPRPAKAGTKLDSQRRPKSDRKRLCQRLQWRAWKETQRLVNWDRDREELGAEGTLSFKKRGQKLIFEVVWGIAPWGKYQPASGASI